MNRVVLSAALATAALCSLSGPALAAAPKAIISTIYCESVGGAQTVPAGTRLIINQYWGTATLAQQRAFRKNVTMRAKLDGVAITGANQYFQAPNYNGNTEAWNTTWSYPYHVMARDESVVIRTQLLFNKRTFDGWDYYNGPQRAVLCTITAV